MKFQYVYTIAATLCFLSLVAAAVILGDRELLRSLFYGLIGLIGGMGVYGWFQTLLQK